MYLQNGIASTGFAPTLCPQEHLLPQGLPSNSVPTANAAFPHGIQGPYFSYSDFLTSGSREGNTLVRLWVFMGKRSAPPNIWILPSAPMCRRLVCSILRVLPFRFYASAAPLNRFLFPCVHTFGHSLILPLSAQREMMLP